MPQLDTMHAMVEEREQALAELSKAEYDFKRTVLESPVHERTGKLAAERILR